MSVELTQQNCALVVIDLQGKLAVSVQDYELVFERLDALLPAAKLLALPILWVEHVPEKLGPTHESVAKHLQGLTPISKDTFNSLANLEFQERLAQLDVSHLILVGVESHVCVLQTAEALISSGYHIYLVGDAVSSRNELDKRVAVQRLQQKGATLCTTESLLFELLKTPRHAQFRNVLSLVK